MEIRTTEDIVRNGYSIRPQITREEYFKIKWVSVESLLDMINEARDNGNIEDEKGFSPALLLSKILKYLE